MYPKIVNRMNNKTGTIFLVQVKQNLDFPVECVFAQDYINGKLVSQEDKIVCIISSQFGCAMKCEYCAVPYNRFGGNLSVESMLDQLNILVNECMEADECAKMKVHVAREGEPSFNYKNVVIALRELKGLYPAFNPMPCFTTMAPDTIPKQTLNALNEYLKMGDKYYDGEVQLQFSVNSTDEEQRARIFNLPITKFWHLAEISHYCNLNADKIKKGRLVTLNFIGAEGYTINPDVLEEILDPELYVIKITPVNTSKASVANKISSAIDWSKPNALDEQIAIISERGFNVIKSVTAQVEDETFMGCGQLGFLEKEKTTNE